MFCSGCGTQIQVGLNYCSRCGRRVAEDSKPAENPNNPLKIAGNTAGWGFGGFIFVISILTKYGEVPPTIFIPVTFFYFAALFGICFMIIRHGSAARTAVGPKPTEQQPDPVYLRPATTAQLEEGREFDIGSVTDATTRTLDQVPIDKQRN